MARPVRVWSFILLIDGLGVTKETIVCEKRLIACAETIITCVEWNTPLIKGENRRRIETYTCSDRLFDVIETSEQLAAMTFFQHTDVARSRSFMTVSHSGMADTKGSYGLLKSNSPPFPPSWVGDV